MKESGPVDSIASRIAARSDLDFDIPRCVRKVHRFKVTFSGIGPQEFPSKMIHCRHSSVLLFVCCVYANVSFLESISQSKSHCRVSATAFTIPSLSLGVSSVHNRLSKSCSSPSKLRFHHGLVYDRTIRFQPRNPNRLSALCRKPDTDAMETANKTSPKSERWNLWSLTADIDSELMKNDISLISIYSLGDSIIEVLRY
jgi:hypothetical protein